VISAWVSYTWESGKGFRWTQLSNMQEEQNLKQKKNDENFYWKILYTITYIRKTKRKLISFGIPKTKPKQSRPKNPKTKQTKRKTKNNNQIPIKTLRSDLLDKWKCFLIHLLAGPQPRFRKHPFFILETVTPKLHSIIIHHELVLASFYWCKMTLFFANFNHFNYNHQHATKLPMLIQMVYKYRQEKKMRKIKPNSSKDWGMDRTCLTDIYVF